MKFSANTWLRALASLRITAVILVLFFILTLVGTFLQVEEGLWASQNRIFHAWIAQIPLGSQFWLPFPGVLLVGSLALVNLSLAMFFRLRWTPKNSGLIVLHAGVILLLLGGALGYASSKDYFVDLAPGVVTQEAESPIQWELGLRAEDDSGATWHLYSLGSEDLPASVDLGPTLQNAKLLAYVPNGMIAPGPSVIPDLTIKEPEKWTPAIILTYHFEGKVDTVALGPSRPAHPLKGTKLILGLRKHSIELPFSLNLIQFKRTQYAGTGIAQAFESHIELKEGAQTRKVQISMNQPLRLGDYTLFQSSWKTNRITGMEHSILTVVRNPLRTLPYYATLLIGLGLLLHILMRMILVGKTSSIAKGNSLHNGVTPLLVLAGLLLGASPSQASNLVSSAPESMRHLPILSEGRIKPLETHAYHFLISLSGRSKTKALDSLPAMDAATWWISTLLHPQRTQDIPVFLIENPEVRNALELQGKDRDRYSWLQISPLGSRIDSLATQAQFLNPKDRSAYHKEMLRLSDQWQRYSALTHAMEFLRTTSVMQSTDSSLPKTFLDLARQSAEHSVRIDSLLNIPSAQHTHQDSLFLHWLENSLEMAEIWSRAPMDLYPVAIPEQEVQWKSYGDELHLNGLKSKELSQHLDMWDSLYISWGHASSELINQIGQKILEQSHASAGPNLRISKIQTEVMLHRLSPFSKAMILFIVSSILAALALRSSGQSPWKMRLAVWLSYGAIILMVIGMAMRMQITGRPPVTNLYETLVFVAFTASFILLLVKKSLTSAPLLASLSGALLLLLAQRHGSNGDTMPVLVAVLDSNFWLSIHVITISLGYGAVIASGVAAHWHLWLGTLTEKGKAAFKTVRLLQGLGLLLTFVGTLLGGIWADQSWGRFWGWDPKENGALLIVLWSAFLFHGIPAGIFKAKGFSLGAIFGIPVVLFAWFGVNLLGVGLHSYGFTEGTFYGLMAYGLVQLGLVGWLLSVKRKV